MNNDKLLIGGAVVIVLLIAIPIIGPMVRSPKGYDPVADTHKIDQLNQAIENYARVNGQYPPTLFYLSPKFIKEIPVTSTNLQFEYDPRTGKITNPSAPVIPPPAEKKEEETRFHRF